ncbi:MAG: DUF47 family protein [Lactobacillus sp.]|jgi:uncharacterized protein Yka (UPF0111/DUF47 family)|nr:DUF47 family protein [Lactobacillus sp.]MCI1973654.1 DUF47 family protein [Lactobacillus sp.]
MGRKQDKFYFDHFIQGSNCTLAAGKLLAQILTEFEPAKIDDYLQQMHALEEQGDTIKHELSDRLIKAFITPFDREDIVLLSQLIDDATDRIDDVVVKLYTDCVTEIRPEAVKVAAVLVETCQTVQALMEELPRFKHNREFAQQVIKVNLLEEKADKLYEENMRHLHATEQDPLQVIVWRDLFLGLERAVDTCENLADTVDAIVMKNS